MERQPLEIEDNLKYSSDTQLRDYSVFLASELDKYDRHRIDLDQKILRNRQYISDLSDSISSRSRQLATMNTVQQNPACINSPVYQTPHEQPCSSTSNQV